MAQTVEYIEPGSETPLQRLEAVIALLSTIEAVRAEESAGLIVNEPSPAIRRWEAVKAQVAMTDELIEIRAYLAEFVRQMNEGNKPDLLGPLEPLP